VGLLEIVVLQGRMDQKDQLAIKVLKDNLAKMERPARGNPVRRVLLDPQGQWALKDQLDNPPRMDHRDRKVLQDRQATQVKMVLLGQLGHQAQPVDLDLRRNCVLAILMVEQAVQGDLDLAQRDLAQRDLAQRDLELEMKGKMGKMGKMGKRVGKMVVPVLQLLDLVNLSNKLTIIITIYHVYHCKYCD